MCRMLVTYQLLLQQSDTRDRRLIDVLHVRLLASNERKKYPCPSSQCPNGPERLYMRVPLVGPGACAPACPCCHVPHLPTVPANSSASKGPLKPGPLERIKALSTADGRGCALGKTPEIGSAHLRAWAGGGSSCIRRCRAGKSRQCLLCACVLKGLRLARASVSRACRGCAPARAAKGALHGARVEGRPCCHAWIAHRVAQAVVHGHVAHRGAHAVFPSFHGRVPPGQRLYVRFPRRVNPTLLPRNTEWSTQGGLAAHAPLSVSAHAPPSVPAHAPLSVSAHALLSVSAHAPPSVSAHAPLSVPAHAPLSVYAHACLRMLHPACLRMLHPACLRMLHSACLRMLHPACATLHSRAPCSVVDKIGGMRKKRAVQH
jgi:hypothetical protein